MPRIGAWLLKYSGQTTAVPLSVFSFSRKNIGATCTDCGLPTSRHFRDRSWQAGMLAYICASVRQAENARAGRIVAYREYFPRLDSNHGKLMAENTLGMSHELITDETRMKKVELKISTTALTTFRIGGDAHTNLFPASTSSKRKA
jgi:hypothetical protein